MTWFLFELVVLTAVGTFFRGPGWAWVLPWGPIKDATHMKQKLTSLWHKLFGDSVRAFGVVSVVFLFSIAIAPAKNHFSEWRHYQHAIFILFATAAMPTHCSGISRAAFNRYGCPNSE